MAEEGRDEGTLVRNGLLAAKETSEEENVLLAEKDCELQALHSAADDCKRELSRVVDFLEVKVNRVVDFLEKEIASLQDKAKEEASSHGQLLSPSPRILAQQMELWTCTRECGYFGLYEDLQIHEETCHLNTAINKNHRGAAP